MPVLYSVSAVASSNDENTSNYVTVTILSGGVTAASVVVIAAWVVATRKSQ